MRAATIILCAFIALLFVLFGLARAVTTIHYVDHQQEAGDNNGNSKATAWISLESAFNGATFPTGSIVHVRQSHNQEMAGDWTVNDDGTAAAPIWVLGDDGTIWPGSTGSTATITTTEHSINFSGDTHWRIENINFNHITDIAIYTLSHQVIEFVNCEFIGMQGAADYGMQLRDGHAIVRGCSFSGNGPAGQGINMYGASLHVDDCDFDGLAYGVGTSGYETTAWFTDCDFGAATANTADLQIITAQSAWLHDCRFPGNDFSGMSYGAFYPPVPQVYCYYRDGSDRPCGYAGNYMASIGTSYTVNNGADYSVEVETPTANVPDEMAPLRALSYNVDCSDSEARTYTLYAQRNAAWGTAPAAGDFYMELTYASGSTTYSATSTTTLDNASQWYAFQVSATPTADGPVRVAMWLKANDTTGSIYIDPLLITDTSETYNPTFNWGDFIAGYLAPSVAGGQIIIIN